MKKYKLSRKYLWCRLTDNIKVGIGKYVISPEAFFIIKKEFFAKSEPPKPSPCSICESCPCVCEEEPEREQWIHLLSGGQSTVWIHNGHLHSASGILDEHDRHVANDECENRYPTPPTPPVSENREKTIKLNSELKTILEYIVSGQIDRLHQSEWVNVAHKLLNKGGEAFDYCPTPPTDTNQVISSTPPIEPVSEDKTVEGKIELLDIGKTGLTYHNEIGQTCFAALTEYEMKIVEKINQIINSLRKEK